MQARAASTGLQNICFVCANAAEEAKNSVLTGACGLWAAPPDLVIGLHACGGLTDLILKLATVPRCHHTEVDTEARRGGTESNSAGAAGERHRETHRDTQRNPQRDTETQREAAFPSFLVVPCCFNKHPHLVAPDCDWAQAPGGTQLSADEVALLQRLAESTDRSTFSLSLSLSLSL